jgi:hypothetical protein
MSPAVERNGSSISSQHSFSEAVLCSHTRVRLQSTGALARISSELVGRVQGQVQLTIPIRGKERNDSLSSAVLCGIDCSLLVL